MGDRISIVIAEDSLLVRDSVSRALSTNPDVTVVGVAEDYDSAVELEKHQPTTLITDVRMPPTSTDEGIRLAQWLRTAHPNVGVINDLLTSLVDKSLLSAETRCGRTRYRFSETMRQYALDRLRESGDTVA